jgi:hypothetical protein
MRFEFEGANTVEHMTTKPSVQTGQPTFSDEEMAVLFRALSVEGDVRNELDCERAMMALNETLVDPERARDVTAQLEEVAHKNPALNADAPLFAGERVTPIHEYAEPGTAEVLIDDEPSTGRVLNWKNRPRRSAGAPDASHGRSVRVTGGHVTLPHGGERSDRMPTWSASSSTFNTFISRASESLPALQPSLLLRISQWFRRDVSESSWRAFDDRVDVQLRHGERHWHVMVIFQDQTVLVQVAKNDLNVVEHEVTKSAPEAFSQTILHALDGDVMSTRLALEAVQKAMAQGSSRSLH